MTLGLASRKTGLCRLAVPLYQRDKTVGMNFIYSNRRKSNTLKQEIGNFTEHRDLFLNQTRHQPPKLVDFNYFTASRPNAN